MKVDETYFLNPPNDNIDYAKYMLAKYSYGDATVFCGKCNSAHMLSDVEILNTELDNYDRRMVTFVCPKCGNIDMDMLDIRNLDRAEEKKGKKDSIWTSKTVESSGPSCR